ncbi:MAG: hypothetical protein ACLQHL_12725, partial [Candidatus Cybelea sp.]
MSQFGKKTSRVGALSMIALGLAIAFSSFAVVRAEHASPDKNKVSCNKSTACIEGTNTGSGSGIEGVGTSGCGVCGSSSTSIAGGFQNDSNTGNYALVANNVYTYGDPFIAENTTSGGYFYVDFLGDGAFTGNVYTQQSVMTNQRTRDGGRLGTYGTQSTRATIEDTGTSRLMNGEDAVRFDAAFARTLDLRQGYQVFLTPDGDTRGLYIAAKYEGGFIVRETEHGRSSIDFDYRVV